jgi:threonine/homoserine/homoserine lactone efflux protein
MPLLPNFRIPATAGGRRLCHNAQTFKTDERPEGHIEAMDGLPGFLLAAVALAGSPGPATLSLAATGAAFGAGRGVAYLAGIVVGMVAVMAVVAGGLVGLLMAIPGATPVVTALAAVYVLYLAWRIAMTPPLTADAGRRRAPTFVAGLLLSLANPKGYAAMAALYSGFVLVADRLDADIAAKMTVLTLIIAAVNVGWLLAGAGLTHFFREPRSNRLINVAFAVLLVVSVVLAFL